MAHQKTEERVEESFPDQLYFHTLGINQVKKDDTQAYLEVIVESGQCKKPLLCKVDTGAEGNGISLSTYELLFPGSPCDHNGIPTMLSPSSTIISAFGGHTVRHYGTCVLKVTHQDSCKPYTFHVVDAEEPTILGLPTCRDLNLVILNFGITAQKVASRPSSAPKPICDPDPAAMDEVLKNYGDYFQGIECFQGEFLITVDLSIPPVMHPSRGVPKALKESLKKELDSLVNYEILAKVTEPSYWVTSLICVTKSNDALRLYLDPKDRNHAIKRPHYFTPMLEDILLKLMVQIVSRY